MTKVLTPDEVETRQVEVTAGNIVDYLIKNYQPDCTVYIPFHQDRFELLIYPHVRNAVIDLLKQHHWEIDESPLVDEKNHLGVKRAERAKEANLSNPAQ